MNEFDRKNIEPEWVGLVTEFPEIFLEPSPDVLGYFEQASKDPKYRVVENVEDLCNLRYSFECDIGWEQIIREFCQEMRDLIKKAKDNGDEIFYKTCILKEKFGECESQGDFYGKNYKEYWDEYCQILRNLSEKSSRTCEITGKPGSLVKRNYWCKTLCEEEAEKWKNYR